MADKISLKNIADQYKGGVENYKALTLEVGLWDSEKYVFEKYIDRHSRILDIGCGTGRTTFGLYKIGCNNIIGLDLTPEMILEAKQINEGLKYGIDFRIGDATKIDFDDSEFDIAIFSFNGIMSIPDSSNRLTAFKEINRILKANGIFIFTTHDRNREEKYLKFWEEEKERWRNGNSNSNLYEFGDLITSSKNDNNEIFIHIPDMDEVIHTIRESDFELIETFYRIDKFDEPQKVKEKSGECRFWVAKKTSRQHGIAAMRQDTKREGQVLNDTVNLKTNNE